MPLLEGMRGLIVGFANKRSLAYAIAKQAANEGARLAVTYQDDRLGSWVKPLASEIGAERTFLLDVRHEDHMQHVRDELRKCWGRVDFLVHSVAYAEREDLMGRLIDTRREGFASAMDVSVYSLLALVRNLEDLLKAGKNASVLTLTYYGSEKAVPHYNVMGIAKAGLESAVRYLALELGQEDIRINALSAGPIKTLSAAGIPGLRDMLVLAKNNAPLKRNITHEDVGKAGLFLVSPLASGLTGEVVHVDAGLHALGLWTKHCEVEANADE